MQQSKHKYLVRIENLGFGNFFRYMVHKKLGFPRSGLFRLFSRLVDAPLWCRGGTSDIDVFKHIFVLREYAGIGDLGDPELIVDCGANAGFSAAYFLSQYPRASVLAVEPDPGNFAMLKRNAEPFGSRCVAFEAGIWPTDGRLNLIDSAAGDGREWAKGVAPAQENEAEGIEGISIPTLLARSGKQRISFLKIDIEGAELELFSQGAESWLPLVDRIAIELHGDACEKAYRQAVDAAGFESVEHGGLMPSTRKGVNSSNP